MKRETGEESSGGSQPPAIYSVKEKLPRFGQWVMVFSGRERSLGFLGPHGIWRDVHSGCPLDNVESWQSLEGEPQPRGEQPTRQAAQS